MLKNILLLVICSLAFVSCSKIYQGRSFVKKIGYTDKKLDNSKFEVCYSDRISFHVAFHKALLRSAEITIVNDKKYFSIDKISSYIDLTIGPVGYIRSENDSLPITKSNSLLKNKDVISEKFDKNFSVDQWNSLTLKKRVFSGMPYIAELHITTYKSDPGYFVFDAEKVYSKVLSYYDTAIQNKLSAAAKKRGTRENYSVLTLADNVVLIMCAGKYFKNIKNSAELSLLVASEYALIKKAPFFSMLDTNMDKKNVRKVLMDPQLVKKGINYNINNCFAAYLVIKLHQSKDNNSKRYNAKNFRKPIIEKYQKIAARDKAFEDAKKKEGRR
ncbi:MAG: hypothetical protein COA79_19105 [Planctomycetota bacterium]|nr:MAG: hypothetical protein COA79_19105 [Planctomycetota bacterium]